ncbi:MAG: metal ABC transporter solute-binding protein, Zn/Mn family [Solirubrobacterales bacterium]
MIASISIAALESPATLFDPVFARRAALAIVLVCVLSAAIGPTIVLRDLPFFTHAVGAGAYPALVGAVALGLSLSLAALAGGLIFALLLWALTRGAAANGDRRDAVTGIAVATALGAGAVLAATSASGNLRLAAPPEALLFGSVLTVDSTTLLVTGLVALAVAIAGATLSDRWLAGGFDGGVAGQLGAARYELFLLPVVALAAAATLPVTGSLMAGSLLVVPAATARLFTDRASLMTPLTFGIALAAGAAGLYCSLAFDLPAGAAVAAATAALFVAVAATRALARGPRLRHASLALVALLAIAATGCGSKAAPDDDAADGKTAVVATTTQVGDLARQIGGDGFGVTTLLPAGADPHEYEPKPSAVASLAKPKAIFRSGGTIDAWLEPAWKAAGNSKKPIDLSNAATLIGASGAEQFNPHWYLSTENLGAAAQRVRDELIKVAPSARETARANTTAYLTAIDDTNTALKACVAKVPVSERVILTGHDDFDYLAQQFGFKVAAQLADAGAAEPSAKDVQDATDAARKAGAKAVVVSKGELSSLAEAVAKKLKVPVLQLYADSLAASGPASTALGAVAYNVGQITSAVSKGAVKCPPAATH